MMQKIITRQIPNGPLILGYPTSSFRTAALALFIATGSRFESAKKRGISHLLEHLLFRGSNRFNAEEIIQWVEGQGGALNAFTAEEYTCLHLQIFPSNWEKALAILLDMTFFPLLNENDIRKERAIILDEAKSHADQPLSLLSDLFSKSLWGKHSLSHKIEGDARALRALTSVDIACHHRLNYRPEMCTIAFVGDLNIDDLAKSAQNLSINCELNVKKQSNQIVSPVDLGVDLMRRKRLEQVHFQIGMQLNPVSDQERCAQNLLSVIVGESMGSRLFQEMREKMSLAYHLNSECAHFSDKSCFSIQVVSSQERFFDCLNRIKFVVSQLQNQKIEKKELERAKSYFLGTTLQELDNPLGLALWLGEQLFCGWSKIPMTPAYFETLVESIDINQMQNAAHLLQDRALWRGAFVGPLPPHWTASHWRDI